MGGGGGGGGGGSGGGSAVCGQGTIRSDARAPYHPTPCNCRPPSPRAPRRSLPSRASTSMTRVRALPTCTCTCHAHVHVPRRRLLPLRLRSHAVRRASQASCSSRTSSARSSPPTALCSWAPTCALLPAPTRRTRHAAARSGLAPRPRGGQSAHPCGFPARPSPPTHTVAPHGQLRLSLRPAVGQVANDMASDQFCETTIGYKVPPRRPPRRPPRHPLRHPSPA